MPRKARYADIAVAVMRKHGRTQLSRDDTDLLDLIAELAGRSFSVGYRRVTRYNLWASIAQNPGELVRVPAAGVTSLRLRVFRLPTPSE